MKIKSFILSLFLCAISLAQGSSPGVVPTIRDLTNRPPSQINPSVITQGRVTAGDGKGGMYTWSPSSAASIDWTNVLGSALTSTGRWLLSLPSPTAEVSDSSKVDRVGGTGTGLSLTNTSLGGTTALTGPLTSSSTITLANQRILGVAAPSANTDAANKQFVDSKFTNLTSYGTMDADQINVNSILSKYTPNRDMIPYWDSAGRLTNRYSWADVTNLVREVAETVTGSSGSSVVTFYAPAWVYDAADGTINTNDVAVKTAAIQAAIDAASAAYNPTNGAQATLVFQPGSMHLNQLTIMPNMIYKALGDVVIWRATDYSGLDRGIMATRRVDGVAIFNQVGVVNAFDSWKSSPVDYSNPDNWYGLSDNIRFAGPGKFILKVGDKLLNQPPLYLNEVRNFFVEPGAIEVWHGNTNSQHWGISIGGRNVFWQNPVVRNGYGRGHDGVHVINGRRMVFVGGSLETGDDSVALGRLVNGASNVGPDEAIEDIVFLGPICESQRGRVFFAQVGVDQMVVPWTEGNKVRRVTCVGLAGHSGIYRQAGLYFGDFAERQRIYTYRINSSGSSYPNGYSKVPVTGGGGTGAECVIRVVGGQIVGAWPSYISGAAWNNGSGYSSDGTVDLSGLATGSGGSVTAVFQPYRNNLVEDIYVQGNIEIGGDNHDGTQPYGLMMEGCRRITVDVGIRAHQSTNAPAHRPCNILAAEDCRVRLNLSGDWQKSGLINPGQWDGSVVDRLYFENGSYVGTLDTISSVFKLTGYMGSVTFKNNTFNEIRNSRYGIYTFDRETTNSPFTYITNLAIIGNDFRSYSASPSSTYGVRILNTTSTPSVGTLRMIGNDFTGITSHTAGADLRSDVEHWKIYDNEGFITENRQTATIAAGATTVVVTIGTATGFPDTTDEGIGCISIVPLGNWGSASKYWVTPTSATTYTINVDSAPGGSGLKFSLNENTRIKE